MATSLAIVTGTSSGIGQAVAQELLRRGWSVVGLARRPSPLEDRRYEHLQVDLAETARLVDAVEHRIGRLVGGLTTARVALVNNAALVGLLGTVERIDAAELTKLYAVNVVAPAALAGWLLRRSRREAAIRIVNVSSGAAVKGFPGLGAYGSSKAALRMLGMVLGAELDLAGPQDTRDVSVLSYEPGMVDTAMQQTARASEPDVLPLVDMFKAAAHEGRLVPPSRPASEIADFLESDGQPRFSERRLA